MKTAHRFLTAICAAVLVASFAGNALAQLVDTDTGFYWEPLRVRHTSAASVPQQADWGYQGPVVGQTIGFTDSTVFRQGTATAILVDTTVAYPIGRFRFPPGYQYRPASQGSRAQKLSGMQALPGGTDSAYVDTTDATPWIKIRIEQDTTSYNFANGVGLVSSSMDSIIVGAQWSYDRINWFSVSGTPTRTFYANPTGVSGGDGIAIPMLAAGEVSPPADEAEVTCRCYPQLYETSGTAWILDRTLCAASGVYVRFILKVTDGTGQWAPYIGYWRHTSSADLN